MARLMTIVQDRMFMNNDENVVTNASFEEVSGDDIRALFVLLGAPANYE